MKRGQRINPDRFYYGHKCKHNSDHWTADYKSLRLKGINGCVFCAERFAGMTEDEIRAKIQYEFDNFGPNDDETSRKKQIEYSRNWTNRNKDKHNEYVKKYYANLSPEKKAQRNAKQLERYHEKRRQILEQQKGNNEHSGT